MSSFSLQKINQVKGKNTFLKLLKKGRCEFDDFCEEIIRDGNYVSELKQLMTLMDLAANQQPLPKTKFKDITPPKQTVKEHEFKTSHLRVYAFQEKRTGKIIVCGGKKNTQDADIRHFRQLKNEYLQEKEK